MKLPAYPIDLWVVCFSLFRAEFGTWSEAQHTSPLEASFPDVEGEEELVDVSVPRVDGEAVAEEEQGACGGLRPDLVEMEEGFATPYPGDFANSRLEFHNDEL